MEHVAALDGSLLAAPFEALKACSRQRAKQLQGELAAVVAQARSLPDADEQTLAKLETRLRVLKRKYEAIAADEDAAVAQLSARVTALNDEEAGRRLERLLADHLLRTGYVAAGTALGAASATTPLLDASVCSAHERVASALAAGDARPALAWCNEHRPRLQKLKSALEFRLQLQQFAEVARRGDSLAAVRLARLCLAPMVSGSEKLSELQRACALLVLGPGSKRLRSLLDSASLVAQFRSDAALVHGLPRVSSLSLRLQAGLCALNVPHITRESLAAAEVCEDPLSVEAYRVLAKGLPHSRHVHTRLVCPITAQLMNEDNPPAALPNGYCYSRKALEAMAERSGDGRVICPRTGQTFSSADMLKVFLA